MRFLKLVMQLQASTFLFLACIPPGGAELERKYNTELLACQNNVNSTPRQKCECRVAVDEKYSLCDKPEWPRIGICEYRCEGLK